MLAWVSVSAWAGIIQDPAAQIDAGSASAPFYGTGTVNPCGNTDPCNGIVDLYNATGGYLTSITLDMFIATGLTQQTIQQDFTCSPSPFFASCSYTYDSSNDANAGELSLTFLAANPQNGTDGGIPPLSGPNCDPANPDSCSLGHFEFDFLDLELINGNPVEVDGWENSPNLLPAGQTFNATSTYTPEPATSALLVAGIGSLALLRRRNYLSRSKRS